MIDWDRISADQDRRDELATLSPDVLASELQTAEGELAQSWVPVRLPAELVAPGDVLVGKDLALMVVEHVDDPRDARGQGLGEHVRIHLAGVDKSWRLARDYRVKVLAPYPEREALILLRHQTGAQPYNRKTTGSGS